MTEREASREKFEVFYAPSATHDDWKLRDKWDPDTYASSYVQTAWWSWQASRQQALTEAADMVHKGGNFRMALAIRSLTSPIGDKA